MMSTSEEEDVLLLEEVHWLRAENERLRKEVERLELVLDGAQLGIWDWNPQTNAVVFNRRWKSMLGYETHELADELGTWQMLLCPEDAEEVYRELGAHLAGKTPVYATEHRVRHKDGHWVWILDIGRVVERNEQGEPTRATGIHQDISARKQLELELKEAKERAEAASRAKSQFLANMSHEIRTPMSGILGAATLLSETELDADQRELADMVVSSTQSLLHVLNDILDISKIEAGRLTTTTERLDLPELLADVCRLYRQSAEEKGIELFLEYPSTAPRWILSDPIRLRQILVNLIGNAIKFTHCGYVRVSAAFSGRGSDDRELCLSIQDTGIGMMPEEQGRIFVPFEQANAAIARNYGGSGLGTTISRQLARILGGDIELVSEQGRGSTFTVMLPVRLPEQLPAPARVLDLTRNYGRTVILAEDNVINRHVVERMLRSLGVAVICAAHGLEVFGRLDAPHDLILMDSHMPLQNGVETTQALRARGYQKPILALTANVYAEDQARYREAGMNGFIAKPFSKQQLVLELDRFFGQTQAPGMT